MQTHRLLGTLSPLLLSLVLTVHSPLALADSLWSRCAKGLIELKGSLTNSEILPTGPRAIHYESYGEGTFTHHADQFMQVMWEVLRSGNSVAILNVRSPFFTKFIRDNYQELERVHDLNLTYADEDFKETQENKNERDNFQTGYRLVSNYLKRIKRRLIFGPHFNYQEILIFTDLFASLHDRDALEKLKILHEKADEKLVKDRYPKATLYKVKNAIDQRTKNYPHTWARYAEPLAYDYPRLKPNVWLALPTRFPSGYAPFFRIFPLPVNPLNLATEVEVNEGNELAFPSGNLAHDWQHYEARLSDNWQRTMGPEERYALLQHLERFEAHVLASQDADLKKDTDLKKTFYFLFYYMRFESEKPCPNTAENLTKRLANLLDEEWYMILSVFKFSGGINYESANNSNTFKENLKRLLEIQSKLAPISR